MSTSGVVQDPNGILLDPDSDGDLPLPASDGTNYFIIEGRLSADFQVDSLVGFTVAADSGAVGPQVVLYSGPYTYGFAPYTLTYSGGQYLAAWTVHPTYNQASVDVMRIAADGTVVDAAPSTLCSTCSGLLAVAPTSSGFYAFWTDILVNNGGTATTSTISGAAISSNGTIRAAQELISDFAGGSISVATRQGNEGRFLYNPLAPTDAAVRSLRMRTRAVTFGGGGG